MPSSHTTVVAFAATMSLLLFLHRQRQRGDHGRPRPQGSGGGSRGGGLVDAMARAVHLLEVQALVLLAMAVGAGRVYLGYHSADQVAAGAVLGATFAGAWWQLTLAACQRWAALLLRLPPLQALSFRDTLSCPDVHAAEAALFNQRDERHND